MEEPAFGRGYFLLSRRLRFGLGKGVFLCKRAQSSFEYLRHKFLVFSFELCGLVRGSPEANFTPGLLEVIKKADWHRFFEFRRKNA